MSKLDLHNHTVKEAMSVFVRFYNAQLARKDGSWIEVVHGYGSSGDGGKIRKRLRLFLERNKRKLHYEIGERRSGNPGVTYVKPDSPLPSATDALQAQILVYCESPRTESKITGEFRQHGQQKVKAALKRLVKDGSLRRFQKGAYPHYQAN